MNNSITFPDSQNIDSCPKEAANNLRLLDRYGSGEREILPNLRRPHRILMF
jgi:hypothetical protein